LPAPKHRLLEMSLVLTKLSELEIHKEVYSVQQEQFRNKRSLSMQLWFVLCECITTQEIEIKEQLKSLFHVIGKEYQLE